MQEYNEDSKCPKCGSGFVATKYDPAFNQVGRRCERCGHSWYEMALDFEDGQHVNKTLK